MGVDSSTAFWADRARPDLAPDFAAGLAAAGLSAGLAGCARAGPGGRAAARGVGADRWPALRPGGWGRTGTAWCLRWWKGRSGEPRLGLRGKLATGLVRPFEHL